MGFGNSGVAKVAAVCSALALGGGYVCYQSGLVHLPGMHQGGTRVIASSKFGKLALPVLNPTSEPATQPAPTQVILMPSSKSLVISTPLLHGDSARLSNGATSFVTITGTPTVGTQDQRLLISGSKSAVIFTPEEVSRFTLSSPTTQPAAETRPTSAASSQPSVNP